MIAAIAFRLRPGLAKENPIATVERVPLTGCRCTTNAPVSTAAAATTPSAMFPAATTISSRTLAATTLSTGGQSVLAPQLICYLDLGKAVPKDFLELVAGKVATPEQSMSFRVVLAGEVEDDLST